MEEKSFVELEEDDSIKQLKEMLKHNPLKAKEVLQAVAEAQTDYVAKLERQRSCEASNAILDLIAAVMDGEKFNNFAPEQQRNLMKRVIAFQFPNGCGKDSCYCEYERRFYKRFGPVEKKTKK